MLDRTKEPGSAGEPLYQDVITALAEGHATGGAPRGRLARDDGRAQGQPQERPQGVFGLLGQAHPHG